MKSVIEWWKKEIIKKWGKNGNERGRIGKWDEGKIENKEEEYVKGRNGENVEQKWL